MSHDPKTSGTSRVLVLIIIILLILLMSVATFALFANKGFIASRDKLDDARAAYDAAITELNALTDTARAAYNNADEAYAAARLAASKAQEDYGDCEAQLKQAQLAYDAAKQSLTSANTASGNAAQDYINANQQLSAALIALTAAQTALTAANAQLANASTALTQAQTEYQNASSTLALAVSGYQQAAGDYQAAIEMIDSFIQSGGTDGGTPSSNDIYTQTIDAIVEIRAYDIYDNYFKLGSGFFISADGKIVTNYHVIQNAFRLEAFHNDGNFYPVTAVLGYSADIDLAVVQIDKANCLPLEISAAKPKVGDTVYAIGSNVGLTRTFTKGIVSFADRDIEGFEANQYIHYVGITHSGNSGCAILDAYGKVIGVHQLGDTATGDNGLAIPISQLDTIAQDKQETPQQTTLNNAADITDKLLYTASWDNKITITGVSSLIEDAFIRIPSKINGKSVVALDWGNNSANIYYVQHIVVSEGITRIGDYAFGSSYYLLSVTLPSTLQQLSVSAFAQTTELYKIFLEGSTAYYLDEGVLYDNGQTVMYKYPLCKSDNDAPYYTESYSIPQSVQTVCDYAMFFALGIKTLNIPASVRSIGEMAVAYCLNLTSVNIAQGVEYIGTGAFAADINLASITLPPGITTLGESLNDGSGYIYKGVFFDCYNLNSVTFADASQLIAIGDSTFGNCGKLTTINGISTLTGVAALGNATFFNCVSLVNADLSAMPLADIGLGVFLGCSGLKSVTLPSTLEVIAVKAFYGCTALEGIALPYGVKAIKTDAFYGAGKLAAAILPAGLATIEDGAFFGCGALTAINLQATSLAQLGAYAFCGSGLTAVILPDTLGVVSEYAFAASSKLTHLTLSENTLWLKEGAFAECASLAAIDAADCLYPPHLTDASVFAGAASTLTITVPLARKPYFEYDSAWMVYRNNIIYI